ncbi:hypothetical protein HYW72_01255 [Candidatus Nomurabacteria bacterium]|nr:hypothetical protein [Candidatus Nomurabacteria bacterium]
MDKDELKNLIVYTGVYYQDDATYQARSQVWFETFDNAKKLGIKVVVRNDGGLPEEMLERIKAYDNITIVEKTGPSTLGGGRREALQKCLDVAEAENIKNPVFVWIEPEKDNFITEEVLLPLIKEVREGNNIVVAERTEEAWKQLPPFQRWVEKRANARANQIVKNETGIDSELDFWFAPKAFDKVGAQEFLAYNPNKDRLDLWDSIMVPIVEAIKKGKKVRSLPVDFLYNKKQIEVESDESNREIKIKRIEQYAQILKELGDKKWKEFFDESKEQLANIRELNKTKPEGYAEEIAKEKKSLLGNFFKLK